MPYSHKRSPDALKRRENKLLERELKRGKPLYQCNPNLEVKTTTIPLMEYTPTYRCEIVKAVSSCCLCGFNNIDALEVHHIDGHHSNNSWDNIAVVCSNCHTLITKRKLNYWDVLTQRNLKTNSVKKSMNNSDNNVV
jgi:hypothetical protein